MAERITLFSRIKSIFTDNLKKVMNSVFAGETKEYTKMAKKFPKTVMPSEKDLVSIHAIQLKKTEINGKAISETLKNKIKQSMVDILNKPEYRVKTGKFAGRIKDQAVEDFKSDIKSIFEPYTRRGIGEKYPRNIDTIARTELSRTINETRKTYAEQFVAKNQELELEKTWIHSRVPKEPRPPHKKLHGMTIPYKENFTIINKETGETYDVPYPHHSSLPAGEVINCMCSVRYAIRQADNKLEKAWQLKSGKWHDYDNSGKIIEVPPPSDKENKESQKNNENIEKFIPGKNDSARIKDIDGKLISISEYSNKHFKDKEIYDVKGYHWGSSDSKNITAKMVTATSSMGFNPITTEGVREKQLKTYQLKEKELLQALGMRKYAQKRMNNISREDFPNIYRGMSLSSEQLDSIINKQIDSISLTGCTAFTFIEKVADRYSISEWTKTFGSDKIGIKIKIKRDDTIDKSIGMVHDKHSDKKGEQEAFEILSGIPNIKIDKVLYYKEDINKDIKDLKKYYPKVKEIQEAYSSMKNEIKKYNFDDDDDRKYFFSIAFRYATENDSKYLKEWAEKDPKRKIIVNDFENNNDGYKKLKKISDELYNENNIEYKNRGRHYFYENLKGTQNSVADKLNYLEEIQKIPKDKLSKFRSFMLEIGTGKDSQFVKDYAKNGTKINLDDISYLSITEKKTIKQSIEKIDKDNEIKIFLQNYFIQNQGTYSSIQLLNNYFNPKNVILECSFGKSIKSLKDNMVEQKIENNI
jgi:hypothetical protein